MYVCVCDTVRPAQVQLSAGQQLCVVCHDVANGIHFGAITCEGCKVSIAAPCCSSLLLSAPHCSLLLLLLLMLLLLMTSMSGQHNTYDK